MYVGLHANYLLLLSDFSETRILQISLKKNQVSNVMRIRPEGAQSFHADEQTDGHTDMKRLTVAFVMLRMRPKIKYNTRCITENANIFRYTIKLKTCLHLDSDLRVRLKCG
jgi:hypothetical protein